MRVDTQRVLRTAGEAKRLHSWLLTLSLGWIHISVGCILTWISSNAIEATAATCPWKLISEAFAGTGTSWKAAGVQAAVHATLSTLRRIYHETPPSRPPFIRRRR